MVHHILAPTIASLSDLKKDPMVVIAAGEGSAVAILRRNAPVFCCVPARAYEAMLERLDDLDLNALADARDGQSVRKVSLKDL